MMQVTQCHGLLFVYVCAIQLHLETNVLSVKNAAYKHGSFHVIRHFITILSC